MKKLCIITPSLGKYSETFIQNQIEYLPFEKLIVTTGIGEFADQNNIPIASFSLLSKVKRGFGRKFLNEDFEIQQNSLLEKHLKKNKVDHVLFQYGTTAKKAYKACLNCDTPYTIHFHGYDAYTNLYGKDYYKEVLKYASQVVVVSNHMKNQLMNLGCNEEKIVIIPYGTKFKPVSKLIEQNNTKNKFLAVGRFVEKKAPYITILAFAEALKVNNRLTLDMVGEGDLLPMCKDIVKGLDLEKNIKFHGACSHEAVQKMMHKTDFFIQHSKRAESGDSEGLPNAIIEALILNKPVISTYHSGIPEVVENEVNGFLVREGDLLGTKEKIIKAIDYNFKFHIVEYLKLENSIKELTRVINGR